MGIVVKHRPRAFIDTSVATAMLRDTMAREFVRDLRRNGCLILFSPAVGREIAKTHKQKRDEIIRFLMVECSGFTIDQAADILRTELQALTTGVPWQPVPPEPTSRLRSMLSDRFVLQELGDPANRPDEDAVELLAGLTKELAVQRLVPFKQFLAKTMGHLGSRILEAGVLLGIPNARQALRKARDYHWIKKDTHGIVSNIALMAANVWRRRNNLGKGEGSLSDIRLVIEASHGAYFLTCDKELVRGYRLATTEIQGLTPRIIFVPRTSAPTMED
jgi:hypothetical protein